MYNEAMPNKQKHRGRHPRDNVLFAEKQFPRLREAVVDLSHLLSRGYNDNAANKLVGDRYQLAARQRALLLRAACPKETSKTRQSKRIEKIENSTLCLDGYNILITVETMLSGGVLLRGADGCIRDLASVHGSYRKVEETIPAIKLIGRHLQETTFKKMCWYFDAPVSNSGRLAALLREMAEEHGWSWEVEVVRSPDNVLKASKDVITTSDGIILDGCVHWFDLLTLIYSELPAKPYILDFSK